MIKEHWAIHTNPKIWDSLSELTNSNVGIFKVNKKDRYEILESQKGILWVSGPKAGIYALIEFVSNCYIGEFSQLDLKYAVEKNKFLGKYILVKVKYKKLINPILRQQLLNNSLLSKNYGFINPQGRRDFPLTNEEYLEILKLVNN